MRIVFKRKEKKKERERGRKEGSVTEQETVGSSQNRASPMPSACLLSVQKL